MGFRYFWYAITPFMWHFKCINFCINKIFTHRHDKFMWFFPPFRAFFNTATKCTSYISTYIFYQISPKYFAVLFTILRENFLYWFKTVSFLQGYYTKCVIKYTIFVNYQCFTMIKKHVWLDLIYILSVLFLHFCSDGYLLF